MASGHPAHVVEDHLDPVRPEPLTRCVWEEPVERLIKMQDNIVRLEKTIEHTIARQAECEAVLELKVRACAELQARHPPAHPSLGHSGTP